MVTARNRRSLSPWRAAIHREIQTRAGNQAVSDQRAIGSAKRAVDRQATNNRDPNDPNDPSAQARHEQRVDPAAGSAPGWPAGTGGEGQRGTPPDPSSELEYPAPYFLRDIDSLNTPSDGSLNRFDLMNDFPNLDRSFRAAHLDE